MSSALRRDSPANVGARLPERFELEEAWAVHAFASALRGMRCRT